MPASVPCSCMPWSALATLCSHSTILQVEDAEVLPLELEGTLLTTMAAVRDEAQAAVASISGATVEDNRYSISVHFRNCAHESWQQVRALWLLRRAVSRVPSRVASVFLAY